MFHDIIPENDWLGYWGKHMKATAFKTVREYQKVIRCSFQDVLRQNRAAERNHLAQGKIFSWDPTTPYHFEFISLGQSLPRIVSNWT